ncbi:MAG: Salicylate biosynthesis isochorismate synthase [Bacteroidota bacterium]|nr:MAG: Salicylate biosynthesis isochorismate synthase [Bacteroidota bacterium]
MPENQNAFIAFFDALRAKQLPFVLFRLPQTQEIILYQQQDDTHHQTKTITESGFVFVPFLAEASKTYIPNQIEKRITVPAYDFKLGEVKSESEAQNKSYYMQLVAAAKNKIMSSDLKKVVISRQHKQALSGAVATSFLKLTHAYPNAMVYFWSHPHTGDWMGATPETLLNIKQGVCKTMALAGTLPYIDDATPIWTRKEVEEQQIVTDFIQTQLEQIFPKNNIQLSSTYSKRAGNLVHLCADFEMPLGNATAIDVVRLLHPTPAVAGVPVKESLEFLNTHEKHSRKYYAGILGPIANNSVNLFVNLRCAALTADSMTLYVGGGITAQSDAETEWAESQQKAETLLRIL